ncbi:hypothetical protein SLE2022_026030 [Rubroshorea leprosula]
MDIYGLPKPELFRIDDLLNLSNEELFSSTSASSSSTTADQFPPSEVPFNNVSTAAVNPSLSTDFLCVPSDEVAELEWLSQFVDDSFTDFPSAGTLTVQNNASFAGRERGKLSRATTATKPTASMLMPPEKEVPVIGKPKPTKRESVQLPAAAEGDVRRCTHCASEKTPQWRTGPLGPKTLCNACGVRYKSGRLVPEYRPAASPTFVLTQHSNSHRKVLELRRQKEMMKQQQRQQQQQDFRVS